MFEDTTPQDTFEDDVEFIEASNELLAAAYYRNIQ